MKLTGLMVQLIPALPVGSGSWLFLCRRQTARTRWSGVKALSNVNQFLVEHLSKGEVIPLLEERDTQWVNALTPATSRV